MAEKDGVANVILDQEPLETPSQEPSIIFDQKEIERLGRERPACFHNWMAEVGFVFAVVGSMMVGEYYLSGFNILLPSLASSMHIPDPARTWPAAVTNLTTAVLLLPFARLSEIHGGRFIFLGGHMWLLVWSVIGGFSQNYTMLIACRAMQGLGASAFLPSSVAIMSRIYRPGPRKNLVFGLFGAFSCIGFYFGIFFGALSAQILGWKWYFFIGAIICATISVAGILTIPKTKDPNAASIRMDWGGTLTIVPGLTLVVYALTDGGNAPNGWKTPYIYVTLIIGVLCLALAVYIEGWWAKQPLLPAEVFRPKYMGRLTVALFFSYGTFGLFLFYSSFYIEEVLGISPMLTAAWFLPWAIGGFLLALVGGFVLHILSGRLLLLISGFGYLGCTLLFGFIPAEEKSTSFLYWAFVFPAMVLSTIGVDITFTVTNVFITTSLPGHLQAVAGALITSLLYLGTAFWLGVGEMAVSVTREVQGAENITPRSQYQIGFWTGAALAGITLAIFVTVKMDSAKADLTADEKAMRERENAQGQNTE
ncbi:hypothetical protein FALBO_12299 [Fusarium albosuccineum]|uniref:Major facilitator superfamily (MFS) profile domain-containing protein n=1 Tax=Fusarium albosuccineum TaxID=1237068 RepID=A0A8H4L2P3_9HYPO|nr:hypothetical protein FALBO_12299 [Fusarium albosuccineum]